MKAATDSRTSPIVVWNDNWPLGCHATIICVTTNTGGRTYHSCRITIVSVPPISIIQPLINYMFTQYLYKNFRE